MYSICHNYLYILLFQMLATSSLDREQNKPFSFGRRETQKIT